MQPHVAAELAIRAQAYIDGTPGSVVFAAASANDILAVMFFALIFGIGLAGEPAVAFELVDDM